MKNLKVYKSSAGSGKTFTLVVEYLKLVLKDPDDFKSILAITFTNKAADEMKMRIIDALVSLSNAEEGPIMERMKSELHTTDIVAQAGKALRNILHDYSSFSISTIDSFFQRILRSLAREIHLPLNMEVEVDLEEAVLDATDRLLHEVGTDKELSDWLTQLVLQKLDDERGWNLELDIQSVARELYKEKHHNARALPRDEIHRHYLNLLKERKEFEKKMQDFGNKALHVFSHHSLLETDFSFGSSGIAGYFEKIVSTRIPSEYKMTKRVEDALADPQKWVAKKHERRNEIIDLVTDSLHPILKSIAMFLEKEYVTYMTACEILRKIYLFGIVNDLQKKFTEYRNANNLILLADTTRLLSDVIEEQDSPFIYEKTGNRYKHLLIDEFQDTSALQWKNLLPLIINALGSGFTTLVVGDAKQSIYRWRGGNMKLLLHDLFADLKNFQSMFGEESLTMNFRSRQRIVNFNNDFFTNATQLINSQLSISEFDTIKLAYGNDLRQQVFSKNDSGGFVQVHFLESEQNSTEEEENSGWKQAALNKLLTDIRAQLDLGYTLKDICILVRRNYDGNEIANWLFENGIEEIISPDSLLVFTSPKITFLINIFLFLSDNSNEIAKSEIIYYYGRYMQSATSELHHLFSDHKIKSKHKSKNKVAVEQSSMLFEGLENNLFNRILPSDFVGQLTFLGKLPVYELCEQLISIFKLNDSPDAYIQRFQDLVFEYSNRSNSSLAGFLLWWENSKSVREASVIVPQDINAIRIMTIHKSKGLQFRIVMIPFADWQLLPKANELIWMSTAGTPYSELGYVAVNTSSRLSETYFKEEYETEISQNILDNLNLLYVAFTRAEEKLFITSQADNKRALNSIAKLIFRTCEMMNVSMAGSVFESGENTTKPDGEGTKAKKIQAEVMQSCTTLKWQDKLSLRSRAIDLVSMVGNNNIHKINYGILMHSILASIASKEQIDDAIERIVFEGLISEEMKAELRDEIHEVLSVPEIGRYFDKSMYVLNEREIILPGGEVLRPDRVILSDNRAIVIDFKTGRRLNRHDDQVRRYMNVIKNMEYDAVEGWLVYIPERIAVNVL